MTSTSIAWLAQAPSVQRLLTAISEDLQTGRNVLLTIPDGIDPFTIWDALEHVLATARSEPRYLTVAHDSNVSPVNTLAEALGVQWPFGRIPRTAATLRCQLQADPAAPRVIYPDGLGDVDTDALNQWLTLLSDWSAASASVEAADAVAVSLCFILPAHLVTDSTTRVHSDAFLSLHEWFAVPSALEIRLMVRSSAERHRLSNRTLWREHLLPSLSGGDMLLVDYLWDAITLDRSELDVALLNYANERGWHAGDLGMPTPFAGTRIAAVIDGSAPPLEWRHLWQHGAASWTPEYGLEVNSALLAVHQQTEVLTHRCWRGEAALLHPLLDRLRLDVCRQFEQWFGRFWATRWCEPKDTEEAELVRDDPMASQWGHLACIVRTSNEYLLQCQRLHPLIEDARQIRNQIAHYRPIGFSRFDEFTTRIDRIIQSGVITV